MRTKPRGRQFIRSRWLDWFLDPAVTRDRRKARRWVRRFGGRFQRYHLGGTTLYGVIGEGLAPLYAEWNAQRAENGRKPYGLTDATALRHTVHPRYVHRKATR